MPEPIDPLLASLAHFVDHPDQLAEHTMSSVEWEAVEVLMPRILRGKSKEDVKQLLLAEIDGMSKKRLLAVLAGETLEESSSSEEEESEKEEEKVEEEMTEETGAGDVDMAESIPEIIPQESREDGEIDEESVTPPDPGSPENVEQQDDVEVAEADGKAEAEAEEEEEEGREIAKEEDEKIDTDEEIDRQLEKDLEDFLD
uniref:Uncharacterized protein n=1 Tax=Caenorhabditis japonica TaxID=281687 RepID=A0A8R1DYZ0_CAEJA